MTQARFPRHPPVRPHYYHLLQTPPSFSLLCQDCCFGYLNKKKAELELKSPFPEFLLGTGPLEEKRGVWRGLERKQNGNSGGRSGRAAELRGSATDREGGAASAGDAAGPGPQRLGGAGVGPLARGGRPRP